MWKLAAAPPFWYCAFWFGMFICYCAFWTWRGRVDARKPQTRD